MWLCLFSVTPTTTTNIRKAFQKVLQEGTATTGFWKGATTSMNQLHKYLHQQQMHREGKTAGARAYNITPIFSSTPWIQNILENARNGRLSIAIKISKVCIYKLFLSLWKITKRCLFVPKGSFHLRALFILPFHPPQNHVCSRAEAAFTSPRTEEQHAGWRQWHRAGGTLWIPSRNKVQLSLTASSTLTPALLASCSSACTADHC